MVFVDKVEERLARMEELLHQLIGLVGKTNSRLVDLESRLDKTNSGLVDMASRLNQRMGGLEQRPDRILEGHYHYSVKS